MSFFNKNKLPSTPYVLPIDISKKGNKAEIDLYIKSDEERKEFEPITTAFELEFIPYDPRKDPKSKYCTRSELFWKINNSISIDNFYIRTLVGAMLHPLYWVLEGRKLDRVYTKEEWAEIIFDENRVAKLLGGSIASDPGNPSIGEYPIGYIDYPPIPIPNIRLTIIDLKDPNKKIVYDEVLEVKKHPRKGGYFIKFLGYIKLVSSNYKIIAEVQSNAYEFVGTKVNLRIGWSRASWK